MHVESTFSEYGERGSIDVLALRAIGGIALVIEVKTELTAIDDTIRRLDVKSRLGAKLVLDRFGWRPAVVARMLVVLDRSTNRRRVAAHEGLLLRAFPERGSSLRQWVQTPIGPISGLRFVSTTNRSSGRGVTPEPPAPLGGR